ncbi:hypothetical protein RND81_13G117900 [Saponaria officinalis]|uniref:Uncharacterized protein n=1 Tax=Saponaria officinalis TaxID=3572 RepID=A0AAW1GYS3_SAPOF
MGCVTSYKAFIIFLSCLALLIAIQSHNVNGINTVELASTRHSVFGRRSRILERVSVDDLVPPSSPAPAPHPSMVFNPDRSSKRRVPRGSDPIHNRC